MEHLNKKRINSLESTLKMLRNIVCALIKNNNKEQYSNCVLTVYFS